MISIVVSVVKVPVSPEECSTLGAAPLKRIFDAPGRPISRVLSTSPEGGCATISLGTPLPAHSCSLPGTCPPKRKKTNRLPFPEGNLVPAWPCSRWGLPGRRITAAPVVSYTAVSPLLLPPRGLGRYVSVARSNTLRHSGGYPAPCPVERGLSSTPARGAAVARPA